MTQPQVVAAFAELPDGQYISGGEFVCTAFPADDNPRDTIISGLISFAVSFPVAIVIYNCFSLSTATDMDQLHGRTRWLNWPFKYRIMFGPLSWRWASADGTQPPPGRLARFKRFLASFWCSSMYVDLMVWIADRLRPCFCVPPRPRAPTAALDDGDAHAKTDAAMLGWGSDAAAERSFGISGDAHAETVDAVMLAWGADEALERHFGHMTTNFKYAGYVLLNLIWGVFAWCVATARHSFVCGPLTRNLVLAVRITFAYGRLVYNLLGPAAFRDFSNSWGIGVALGQANDAQGVVTSAMQAALLLTILEALWLVPNGRWLEGYIDFVSVQATVAQRGARRTLAILSAYKRHSYAVS